MSSSKYKISIIVPVYNVEKYLPQCLDSLVNQTYDNIEIICVNDGSTDRSLQILEKYAVGYPSVRVITQCNKGLSGARNTGIEFATGDYIMFVDSDDWLDVETCSTMARIAKKYEADCIMCSYVKEYGDHNTVNHIFPKNILWRDNDVKDKFYRRLFGPLDGETRYPQDVDIIVSACMQLFKYDLVKNIKFVDTKKIGTEDCLYQIMVYKNCRAFAYIDKSFYHYRKTNTSSLTTKYNPYLYDRWQILYGVMEDIIKVNRYSPIYNKALNNRILFALIGLGLNEVHADAGLIKKSKRFYQLISTERYQTALKDLDISYMPFHWKVFFFLLKRGWTVPVIMMLEVIEKLRRRM